MAPNAFHSILVDRRTGSRKDFGANTASPLLSSDGSVLTLFDSPSGHVLLRLSRPAGSTPVDIAVGTSNGVSADGSVLLVGVGRSWAKGAELIMLTSALLDTVPPTVIAVPDRAANGAGWYNQPLNIHWSTTDPAPSSGLAQSPSDSYVTTEGLAQQITSGPGCDNAGNCATGHAEISLDSTPPQLSGQSDRTPNSAGWYNRPVTVHASCSDSLSGIASCSTDQVIAGEGAGQSVTLTATDVADNSARAVISGINVDLTAPSTTSTGGVNTPVTGAATDATSGVTQVLVTFSKGASGHGATTVVLASLSATVQVVAGSGSQGCPSASWRRTSRLLRPFLVAVDR